MNNGLILSFGSFAFLILLLLSYYLQKHLASISSKLFRLLLWIVTVLLITEIVSTYAFVYGETQILHSVFLKIHWLTGILFFYVLYLYCVCFLKETKAKTVRELISTESRCKYITIFSLISTIVYLFLPLPYMTAENFTFIPGLPAYFVTGYSLVIVLLIIVLMIKNRNIIDSRRIRAIIIMFLDLSIIVIVQFIFPKTVIFGLGFILEIYFLYFYIENPDLMMIESLEESKKEIEESSLAKTDFLSNMTNEIRSPMNSIVGFSEAILNNSNCDSETIRTNLENITTSGNNLLDIINNILDVSKIESGKEHVEEKEYSIGNVIVSLSSVIKARLENSPVKFITEIDNSLPKTLYGDSAKLYQILLNLLTNSLKNTEVGKIKLDVKKEIKNDIATLKFKISDTGSGIKKEDYDKLFVKSNSTTSNDKDGTGLGLIITKQYVDLLGGKISFESEYGVGTVFYIEIPQRIIDMTPIGDIKDVKDPEESLELLDCSGKKALIVDDNKLNLKVASRILSEYKFEVITITTGEECVYRIKDGEKYDIIFIDHIMPEMNGIQVVRILKKLDGYKIPPVVALTANAITGAKDIYLNEGFDEYLSKPVNRAELNQIINKYFGDKE